MNSLTGSRAGSQSNQSWQIRAKAELERRRRLAPERKLFETIPLYPKQQAIISDGRRFTICEATTKAGKTASHIEWLLSDAITAGAGNWWWVATTSDTADIAFRRTQDRLRGYLDSGGALSKVSEPIS